MQAQPFRQKRVTYHSSGVGWWYNKPTEASPEKGLVFVAARRLQTRRPQGRRSAFRGFPWFSVIFRGLSVVFRGFPWFSVVFRGFPWFSVVFRGFPWLPSLLLLSRHRESPVGSVVFRAFPWFFVVSVAFPWFSVVPHPSEWGC